MVLPLTAVSRDAALRHAAVQAANSPSALHTQPWRLHIRDGALWIYLDRTRQLASVDPQRRVLTLSVGSALLGAQVSLAADGYGVEVHRFPLPAEPDLAAICEIDDSSGPNPALAALHAVAGTGTVPGPTTPEVPAADDVPAGILDDVALGLLEQQVGLRRLDPAERQVVSTLNARADEIEQLDPSYRAELAAWAGADSHYRDRVVPARQCLGLICTDDDHEGAWLRAGEGMRRAVMQLGLLGVAAFPSSQVIEVPSARAHLRSALTMTEFPHVLVGTGRKQVGQYRRRRLVDVLVEDV